MKSLENMYFISGFTEEYPNKPPTVRFVSKMFHPNVYADGGKFNTISIKLMIIMENFSYHGDLLLLDEVYLFSDLRNLFRYLAKSMEPYI